VAGRAAFAFAPIAAKAECLSLAEFDDRLRNKISYLCRWVNLRGGANFSWQIFCGRVSYFGQFFRYFN